MANRSWLRCGQWLLAALVLTAAALLLQASRTGALVETGMQSLVPASHAVDEAELRAEAQGERLLNQQHHLLVGAPDARPAATARSEASSYWPWLNAENSSSMRSPCASAIFTVRT